MSGIIINGVAYREEKEVFMRVSKTPVLDASDLGLIFIPRVLSERKEKRVLPFSDAQIRRLFHVEVCEKFGSGLPNNHREAKERKAFRDGLIKNKKSLKIAKDRFYDEEVIGSSGRWSRLRRFIYERDGGVCQVCLDKFEPEYYECGHIVDRVSGGADVSGNLVCMCVYCNRMKGVDETIESYMSWVSFFRFDTACRVNPRLRVKRGTPVHLVDGRVAYGMGDIPE